MKKKWGLAVQLNALSAFDVRVNLDNSNYVLDSKVRDEHGNPIISLEVDQEGKLTDPVAAAIFQSATQSSETVVEAEQTAEKVVIEVSDAEEAKPESAPQVEEQVSHKPELIPVNADSAITASDDQDKPVQEEKAAATTSEEVSTEAKVEQEATPSNEEAAVETTAVQEDKPAEISNAEPQSEQKETATATPKMTQQEEFEAQRDIAFKVVFFFTSFIVFCFGMLYVYHRMQQAALPESEKKTNFFEFLTGDYDDNEASPSDTEIGDFSQIRYH